MAYAVGLGSLAVVLLAVFFPRILAQFGKYFPSLSLCRSFHAILPTWNEKAKALWATEPTQPITPAAVLFTAAWLGTLILNVPLTAQILELFFSAGSRVTLPFFGPLYVVCLVFALILAVVRAGLGFMLQGRGAREERSYHAVSVRVIWAMLGLIVGFESLLAGVRGQIMAPEELKVVFLTPEATIALISGLLGLIVPVAEIFFGGLSLYEFFDPAGAAALRKAGAVLTWLASGLVRLFIAFHDPETVPLPTPRALSVLEKRIETWLRKAMSLESALAALSQRVPARGAALIEDLKAGVEKLSAHMTEFTKQVHEFRRQSQAGTETEGNVTQASQLFARYTELGSRCADIQGKAESLRQRRWATARAGRSLGRLQLRLDRLAAAARYSQELHDQLSHATGRLKDEATREHNEKLLANLMITLKGVSDRIDNLQETAKNVRSELWHALSAEESAAKEAAQIRPRVRKLLRLLEEAHRALTRVTGTCEVRSGRHPHLAHRPAPLVLPELQGLKKKVERLSGVIASLDGRLETLSKRVEDASKTDEHADHNVRLSELGLEIIAHADSVTRWARARKVRGTDVDRQVLYARGRGHHLRCRQSETRARDLLRERRTEWRLIEAEARRLDGDLNHALGQVRGLKARETRLRRIWVGMAETDRQCNEELLEEAVTGLSLLDDRIVGLKTRVGGISTPLTANSIRKAMGLYDEAQLLKAKVKGTQPLLEPDAEQRRFAAGAGLSLATGIPVVSVQVLLLLLDHRSPSPFWLTIGGVFVALGVVLRRLWGARTR